MLDSKWANVGVNQRGQIHALDAGEFQIHHGTRVHQHRIQLLGHEIHFAPPSQKLPRSLPRPCPERQPIHLPLETCAGLRDIRLLGRGPRGLLWEAQMPGATGTVMRKTARITDRSGLWHRFALYREATMLADLQAHYGPNETARFHGICDATDISIVMDKLDDVQARWLSCLLEKARMCRHSDRACVLGSGGARDAVEALSSSLMGRRFSPSELKRSRQVIT